MAAPVTAVLSCPMTSIVQDKAIGEVELLLLIVAGEFGPTTTRMSLKRVFIHTARPC
ncbi:hypothetical protein X772_36230 [Mesorhizobium sp. LSJC280B00]|nr:hypothetical protein X772_36230 [Mesorhizobium sp. LSJC280B00]